MTSLRQRMLEDLRIRNYAPATVVCYIRAVAEFAKHFNQPPDQLGPEEIRAWQLFLLNEKRVKLSTYIQAVCALRFFYRTTLNRKIEIERIPLPRYEQKLPVILSKEEVKAPAGGSLQSSIVIESWIFLSASNSFTWEEMNSRRFHFCAWAYW